VAGYLTGLGVKTGWYAYAPLSGQLQAPGIGEPGWLRLIIWLAAVSLWSLTSLRVLSQSPVRPPEGDKCVAWVGLAG